LGCLQTEVTLDKGYLEYWHIALASSIQSYGALVLQISILGKKAIYSIELHK
jgi:hypothetical protein